MWHERQSHDDSCRMHALNNVLGGPVFKSWTGFRQSICAEFDRMQGFPAGTSQSVTAPGFFDFALQQVDTRLHATCFLAHEIKLKEAVVGLLEKRESIRVREQEAIVVGLLPFTRDHVWAMKRGGTGAGWVALDSMHHGPSPRSLSSLLSENVGFYLITLHKDAHDTVPVHDHPPPSMRLVPKSPDHGRSGASPVRVVRVLHAPHFADCSRVGVREMDRKRRSVSYMRVL